MSKLSTESKKQSAAGKAIQQLAGAAGSPRCEIDFVLECDGAQQVYVCGDFNNWQPTSLRMIGNPDAGLWEKRLPLAPGRYEYKYFVDGKWVHDPDALENVPNIYGSLNSVLEVKP
ncbi:MAG: glycogen-binding domain-containing protein [Verrucomicrobiae bacterium]|nr:glycogen-binding domain-containing protein [Verrucomicrobiae bacterium]